LSKRKPRPVAIRWYDAAFGTAPHWSDGDRPKPPKGKSLHLCLTVGWLVYMDKEWVQVVATLTDGAHAHVTEIPRGMVREITVLTGKGV